MSVRQLCLAPCEGEHFIFRLTSDALTHLSIPKGSRLLACPDIEARDGDLVIAKTPLGNLARFYWACGDRVCLNARAPDIPPLVLPKTAVHIVGVACTLLA